MKNILAINQELTGEQRRRSELLRLVTLVLLFGIPPFALSANAGPYLPAIYVTCGLTFSCNLIALVFNRLGRVTVGGYLVITGLLFAIMLFLFSSERPDYHVQTAGPLFIIPVIIAGTLIGPRAPLIVALFVAFWLGIITFTHGNLNLPDSIASLSVPSILIVVVGLLSWFFERSFARLVSQLTERNQKLEEINRQIEAKHNLGLQVGERINLLVDQVSAGFAEQTLGANEQLAAVVEVTAALEELNQTNELIARAAGQVASTARETLTVAERGGSTIHYSTQAISLLYAKVNQTTNAMQNLSSQAREIDQIIELITEVADETNLLALNATIEAAGAREYGRRFAAVASEVQRLANRSREAADAVRVVVSEVQDAIRESASASQEGLHEASELTGTARQVGEAIEGIVKMVENTATLAQQISLSIQQQKSAGTQVLDTMRQISGISDLVANNSRELMATMYELNDTADRLKAIDPAQEGDDPGQLSGPSPNEARLDLDEDFPYKLKSNFQTFN